MLDQPEFDIRFEWSHQGIEKLAPISDVVIIVDVMSFSTAVCICVANGAIVYPIRSRDDVPTEYAESLGAILAGPRGKADYTLSPVSMQKISKGDRIVLPSLNGSNLSMLTGDTPTLAGCLRNASTVARIASTYGSKVSVIGCGERWEDGTLRPSFEDLIGAGSIIQNLTGRLSPESEAALAVFKYHKHELLEKLSQCGSGRELTERGFADDILFFAELNVDDVAPVLIEGAYRMSE
ncbi:MAG: 2-phosphosulfolactate phosphatase [Candidatus Heimdallarchaeota archaeon]|nr:2-phosphosulfolactate phosphatase [Candidatus Heimdallarchaeota archaeon]